MSFTFLELFLTFSIHICWFNYFIKNRLFFPPHHAGLSTSIEDSQGNNCPEDMIPKIGMKFNSEQDAHDFYNSYSRKICFIATM
jgi:hypothetical protein